MTKKVTVSKEFTVDMHFVMEEDVIQVDEADFVYLKEQTNATAGNLSVQIDKLSEAGYIQVNKSFTGKKPRTTCCITEAGKAAMEEYVEALKSYLNL